MMGRKLRAVWHELYGIILGSWGEKLMMPCRDLVELGVSGRKLQGIARLRAVLHLSLCQGCKNYGEFTARLRENAKTILISPYN